MASSEQPRLRRRRGFDHLFDEISVAAGHCIPRYPLWLRLHALGYDPECLDRESAIDFCGRALEGFLVEHGVRLRQRELSRVRRSVRQFDPDFPTPYERMAAFDD
jgi:hypothetical protein